MRAYVLVFSIALLVFPCAAQDPANAAAGKKLAPFVVVPDWPKLPDGLVLGERDPALGIPGCAGVDVDNEGDIWVFHRSEMRPIMEFDADTGEIKRSFGDGMFKNAHGLEVDDENNVWVTDTLNHQVYKFSPDGKLLLTVGEKEVSGMDGTHFDQPTDVAVTPEGDFYVTDGYGNNRVAKFDKDGKFLFQWGGRERGDQPGQFNLPHGITLGPDGKVYVADRTNLRIQVFTPDGEFIEQWKKPDDWARPWGLEYHAADNSLYVMDGGHMRPPDMAHILRLSLDGEVLESWSSYGPEPGQLSWGHDLTVGHDGAVYTVEVQNNFRAQKFVRGSSER